MSPISFEEAFAQFEKSHDEPQELDQGLVPSENPEIYAPLLMPPEGYFDHIGATRARKAEARVEAVVEHLKNIPKDADLSKPGAKAAIRTFGVPATSLYNTLEFPPKNWKNSPSNTGKIKAGIEGEELTAKALAQWADDKPDVVICHSVSIPRKEGDDVKTEIEIVPLNEESPEELAEEQKSISSPDEELGVVDSPDTDHVLVVGSQVWIIDSKMWKAGVDLNDPRAVYSFKKKNPKTNKSNYSIVVPGQKYPRYVRMKQAMYLWQKYIGGKKRGYVRGIVNIHPKDVKNPEHNGMNPDEPEYIPGAVRFLMVDEWHESDFKPIDAPRFTKILDKFYSELPESEKGYIDVGLVTLVARTPVKKRTRASEFFGDKLAGFQ